jgi:hypothetical protein
MSEATTNLNSEGAVTVQQQSRRRSRRVMLRVPILLSGMMPDGRSINIEAQSLVVNAHGGMMDVGIELVRGQQVSLRNAKSDISARGRILRVEAASEGHFSVAFEFESPAPHFWPVSFPPADWAVVEPAI